MACKIHERTRTLQTRNARTTLRNNSIQKAYKLKIKGEFKRFNGD